MPTTPEMGLVLPTVGVTTGTGYATLQNNAMEVIDAHDHTSGKGVPVPASGLDINADLPFGSNNATQLRSARFADQTSALAEATDLNEIYVLNGDLYYIDSDGTQIRITENGAISAASFGGITGLTGNASAAFSGSTFTWKSNTNEYARMDSGDLRVRKTGETSPNYVGIASPAALAASYDLTLPGALPLSGTQFLTLSTGGTIAANIATSQGITRAMQAAVGQQISSSTGSYTATATSWTAVTNANVSITTVGRPVLIFCKPVDAAQGQFTLLGTGSDSYLGLRISVTGSATTTVGQLILRADDNFASGGTQFPASSMFTMYVPSAGTYTLTLQAQKSGANSTSYAVSNLQLVAVEL